jgi:REP element-mobilizing transposase RayT
VYHVTSRGNGRAVIYLDDEDREAFLNVIAEVCRRMHWVCYAYCLMTNHYHLVIETLDTNLSRGMRQLNGSTHSSSIGIMDVWGTFCRGGTRPFLLTVNAISFISYGMWCISLYGPAW